MSNVSSGLQFFSQSLKLERWDYNFKVQALVIIIIIINSVLLELSQ